MMTETVLAFWMGEAHRNEALGERVIFWFTKSEATDAALRERFGETFEAASRGELDHLAETPRGRLALLIVLDQFSRNIHRGTPRAFATDARALALALEGFEKGHDRALRPIERLFFYLPLEHAEDLAMQDRAVELFRALRQDAPPGTERFFDGFIDYALRHHEVIAKYGRFPHRNALLGRESTEEERAYLAEPGSGF